MITENLSPVFIYVGDTHTYINVTYLYTEICFFWGPNTWIYWGRPDTVLIPFSGRRILAFFFFFFLHLDGAFFSKKRIKDGYLWNRIFLDRLLITLGTWGDRAMRDRIHNCLCQHRKHWLCSKYYTYFTHLILTAAAEWSDNGFTDEDTEITSKRQAGSLGSDV